ncbi:MAG: segregation/condensation protein A [Candidatus Moranbacteria bacterium]|nr:segregation/condensation protein A [Candidatus Moranbacteria bacterium]
MAYHVHLEKFEGPLDLLLALIEKEKLDITEVSLAQVTDQYLAYIQTEETISLQNLAAFLAIATRLILIKSRALLPILEFSDEEEEAIEDLEYQLKAYRLFREASQKLGQLFLETQSAVVRESFLGMASVFYPPQGITKEALREHFGHVLGDTPVFEVLPEEEIALVVTLEEKIAALRQTLAKRVELSFAEIISNTSDRVEVVVSFLAMLELIKQRFIHVRQERFFSEIHIKRLV